MLRRLEIGPFNVEDADEERVRLPSRRWRGREPRSRISTFDGVHLGHRRVVEEALATAFPVRALTFHPHPRSVVEATSSS